MSINKIGYKKALSLVEKFMADTGIRDYCTDICRGRCCGNCHASENACHKTDSRRLPCSAFMCNSLSNVLLTQTQRDIHYRLDDVISAASYEVEDHYRNIFFNPMPEQEQKRFRMDPTPIVRLLEHRRKIAKKMADVRELIMRTDILDHRRTSHV